MKAISLHQPWASAIAVGAKRVETRSWSTGYRGPLAIHAAKRLVQSEMLVFQATWNWRGALKPILGSGDALADVLPFGAIVAVCELVDCRPTGKFTLDEIDVPRRPQGETSDVYNWTERQMGDFYPGRFGWVLQNIRRLKNPVAFRGSQGFFEVPNELLDKSNQQ